MSFIKRNKRKTSRNYTTFKTAGSRVKITLNAVVPNKRGTIDRAQVKPLFVGERR